MTALRVLIAEDNLDIAENIADFLELNGHQVDFAYDGVMALKLVEQQSFDAIIMDIMMPKLDGIKATEKIRTLVNGDTPILMLTAKDTLDDKLLGLSCGADDYIVKPFEIKELYARLQAQVRKNQGNYHHTITVHSLTLNKDQQSAHCNTRQLTLNPTTFKLLWILAKQYPNLVTKQTLEYELWGDMPPDNDILRSHIYNLRKALDACCPEYKVKGKRGLGYQLTESRD